MGIRLSVCGSHHNSELGEAVEKTLAMDGPVICEILRGYETGLRAEGSRKDAAGRNHGIRTAGGSGSVPSGGRAEEKYDYSVSRE